MRFHVLPIRRSGAICWRDFEISSCGARLLKPTMNHLETWPGYYTLGVACVAHRWGFSGFQMNITQRLGGPERCRAIAGAGQDRYLASLAPHAAGAFAERFVGSTATSTITSV